MAKELNSTTTWTERLSLALMRRYRNRIELLENRLASRATDMLKLGSYCPVFTATEVLESIREEGLTWRPNAKINMGMGRSWE